MLKLRLSLPALLILCPAVLFGGGLACEPLLDEDDGPAFLARSGVEALEQARTQLVAGELPAPARISATEDPTQGSMRVMHGGESFELPLVHTDVDAEISGFLADVAVHQLYANPFDEPIEAVYLFPLPDSAAVDDMQMRIGDRVVVGEIKKREEARELYEAARDAGQTAALLDQERPNVFQQSVANILPGEAIEVTIHFVQKLDYEDGGYEWAFPMVVGPRFIPEQGTGTSGGTSPAEDAARLDAPVSKDRTGNDITLALTVDAGVAIQGITSPSHEIDVEQPGEARADILLSSEDSIPNKDFVLRYEVAGEIPETAFLSHKSGDEGFFMMLLQPQDEGGLRDNDVTPKEMVFVLDTSCSQSGAPLTRSKEAVELAIREMNSDDRFWILNFNSSVSSLSEASLANTAANRKRGIDYIRSFRGSGGTNMLQGIQAALDLPADPDLLRTVVFMTDGYIGNEAEILSTIEERLGNSRLFSFGVGSSTNRYLLDRMAKVGRGHVQHIRHDEDPAEQVGAFYDRIRNPVLTDIDIQWEGVELLDVFPDPVPDLFSAQPLVLVGRYEKAGKGRLEVTGRIRGREYSRQIDLDLPEREAEHGALRSLWARTVIEDLEGRQYAQTNEEIKEQITKLSLEYRLMTRFTSFVAVEEKVVVEDGGPPKTVRVPLETPAGVSHEAIFGAEDMLKSSSSHHSVMGSGSSGGGISYRKGARGRGKGASGYGRGRGYYGKKAGGGGSSSVIVSDTDLELDVEPSPPPGPAKPIAHLALSAGGSWGGIEEAGGRSAIERRLRGIKAAWADWLADHPEAQGGEWTVRMSLNRDGRVTAVELVSDSLGIAALEQSFRGQAVGWWLPAPGNARPTTIEVELRFSAER